MDDHRQGQVGFALEAPVGLGNARRLAARRIARPCLGQKQPTIDQGHLGSPTQGGEYADLAVLDFAQLPTPLPRHPHRLRPFLRATALIDQQGAVGMPAQQPARILGDLIQHRPFGPGRLAQHVVQGLMIRLGNRLFHPLHILGFRLEQPAHLVSRRGLYSPGSATEVTAEMFAEVQEPLTNPGQQPDLGIGHRVFLNPFALVSVMIHFMKPCLLVRVELSLFIDKIQIDESDKVELNNP